MEKTKKPRSEAQKAADKRYYESKAKNRQKYITLHTMKEEREDIDKTLQEHNITALELFRKAIEELKKGNL